MARPLAYEKAKLRIYGHSCTAMTSQSSLKPHHPLVYPNERHSYSMILSAPPLPTSPPFQKWNGRDGERGGGGRGSVSERRNRKESFGCLAIGTLALSK